MKLFGGMIAVFWGLAGAAVLGLAPQSVLWSQSLAQGITSEPTPEPKSTIAAAAELALGLGAQAGSGVISAPNPSGAAASESAAWDYVAGNVLTTFYHELGHALIDQLDLPVLGREEDAADSLSVVLTEKIWSEDWAQTYVAAQALNYLLSADENEVDESDVGGVHSLDMQRYYTHICLFYGANPDARSDWPAEFELPENRVENCAWEYQQAQSSWQRFLNPLEEGAPGKALRFVVDQADSISILIADEVDDLNEMFALPQKVDVTLEDCGEVNAFYYYQTRKITICTEYVDWLWSQAETADL